MCSARAFCRSADNDATSGLKCWGGLESALASLAYVNFDSAGGGYATKVSSTHSATCAIVEGGSCSSKLMCWRTFSASTEPSCVDLDALPVSPSAKSYTESSAGLHVTDLSCGWEHGARQSRRTR